MTLNEKIAESRGFVWLSRPGENYAWLFHPDSKLQGGRREGIVCSELITAPESAHRSGFASTRHPRYTSDANAALTLIEALAVEGYVIEIHTEMIGVATPSPERFWRVTISHDEGRIGELNKTADTFELAVARAYCAVKGIKIEG